MRTSKTKRIRLAKSTHNQPLRFTCLIRVRLLFQTENHLEIIWKSFENHLKIVRNFEIIWNPKFGIQTPLLFTTLYVCRLLVWLATDNLISELKMIRKFTPHTSKHERTLMNDRLVTGYYLLDSHWLVWSTCSPGSANSHRSSWMIGNSLAMQKKPIGNLPAKSYCESHCESYYEFHRQFPFVRFFLGVRRIRFTIYPCEFAESWLLFESTMLIAVNGVSSWNFKLENFLASSLGTKLFKSYFCKQNSVEFRNSPVKNFR